MTTVHRLADGSCLSITKGAAEVIIGLCVREQRAAAPAPLVRQRLGERADAMAAEGLRVLGFAVRRWPSMPDRVAPDALERELEFVGLAGLIDPPRPEVRRPLRPARRPASFP